MGGVWWCSQYKPLFYRSHTLPVRVTEQHVYYCTDWGEARGKLIRRRTRLFMDQGEDQAESQGPSQDRSIMHGPRQCLALVNDNEQKLYNILNAHGLGVYYTITTSQEMNHHYSTAGLSPSTIAAALNGQAAATSNRLSTAYPSRSPENPASRGAAVAPRRRHRVAVLCNSYSSNNSCR